MRNKIFRLFTTILSGLFLVLVTLLSGKASRAQGGTIYCVNQSGIGCAAVCNGGCFNAVQGAVDAASPGAEIRIAEGTYQSAAKHVAVITKELELRGGYGDPCADDDFDPDLHRTILDAQKQGSVISITNAASVELYHLTLTRGSGHVSGGGVNVSGSNFFMGNCVITNNVASTSGSGFGGGVYVNADGYTVKIWDNSIISNTASASSSLPSEYGNGGGIYIYKGEVLLQKNEIRNNTGSVNHSGMGGIYLRDVVQANVLTNTITGNRGNANRNWYSGGGGISIEYSTAIYVAGNDIENNWAGLAAGLGGGVNIRGSDVHLARNNIISNTGGALSGKGGGVYILSSVPVTLTNNIIARNTAPYYGDGVIAFSNGLPASRALLVNNTIVDNNATGVYAQYAVVTLTNNIVAKHTTGVTNTTPASSSVIADTNLFWNSSDPITGANAILADPHLSPDYHLYNDSPAVDTGLTISWLTVDLAGAARPQGSGYDIGAYEGSQEVPKKIYLPLVLKN